MQGNLVLAHRHDAARMQHLRPVAGNFLRLIVVQLTQQPRGGHRPWIGAEQAGHIGPNLQARSLEFRREIRAGGVGPSPAQQHRIAGRIRRDETLSDHHPVERMPIRLQARVGDKVTGRRQQARLERCAVPFFSAQDVPRVHPNGTDTLRA